MADAEDDAARRARAREDRRRAALAFGVALICAMSVLETYAAHRTTPHPASPVIWTVLGAVAAVAVALGIRWHLRARAQVREPRAYS